MPFIERVKSLFARKGDDDKKIAFLSETTGGAVAAIRIGSTKIWASWKSGKTNCERSLRNRPAR